MSVATKRLAARATKARAAVVLALRTACSDIVRGLMLTSHFIVTLAGAVALIGGALVFANDGARAQVKQHWSQLVAKPASAGNAQDELTAAVDRETSSQAEESRARRAEQMQMQTQVTQYLSRRYRVAEGAIRPVVAAAFQSGKELELDPLLILAVMAIESSMNPFAESHVGAQGLMQVMTRVHLEKFEPHGGEEAALNPIANVKVGSLILKDLISRGGSVERGLQLYVGAGNMTDDGGYGARVLAERARLKLAAGGNVIAALNAGQRPAVPEQTKPEAQPVSLELQPSDAIAKDNPAI